MPIYEYICGSCQHEFEVLIRSATDAKDLRCPRCESTTAERKLSVFATHQGSSKPSGSSPGTSCQCGLDGPCSI